MSRAFNFVVKEEKPDKYRDIIKYKKEMNQKIKEITVLRNKRQKSLRASINKKLAGFSDSKSEDIFKVIDELLLEEVLYVVDSYLYVLQAVDIGEYKADSELEYRFLDGVLTMYTALLEASEKYKLEMINSLKA